MNKRKKSRVGLFVIIGLFVYFAYTMIDQQQVMYMKNNEIKSIEAKIQEEMKLNNELKKQKEVINTDEYAEKAAREKLGMVKHGEKVFVDIDK